MASGSFFKLASVSSWYDFIILGAFPYDSETCDIPGSSVGQPSVLQPSSFFPVGSGTFRVVFGNQGLGHWMVRAPFLFQWKELVSPYRYAHIYTCMCMFASLFYIYPSFYIENLESTSVPSIPNQHHKIHRSFLLSMLVSFLPNRILALVVLIFQCLVGQSALL